MREILFKAKRKDNKEWIEGYYVKSNFKRAKDRHYITCCQPETRSSYCGNYTMQVEIEEIIPETISQYTGLKDKNGVEIFEGDIIENKWTNVNGKSIGSIWEVKFGEYDNSDIEYGSGGNIGFYAYDTKNECEEGLNNLPSDEGIEIIGNIFDEEVK